MSTYVSFEDKLKNDIENDVNNYLNLDTNQESYILKNENIDNKLKVSVYAISKNEIKFVDKWIESMSEADYIVVLDTGSNDGTYEKLLEYRKNNPEKFIIEQKIYDQWRFDVARNDSMNLCPDDTDIYLSTDLDELLDPGWYEDLTSNWIKGVHERANYLYTWSHMDDGSEGRIFWYNKVHTKNWIWKYPVHELLWNINTESELYDEKYSVSLTNMHLHHYPDPEKSRGSYLKLLELRASENKEDYYGLIYLGHEYLYSYMYEKCIFTLNKVLNEYKLISSVEKASCYLFIGDAYKELGMNQEAFISYSKAIYIDSTYLEPYLNIAKLLISEEKYEMAIGFIKEGLNKSYRHYVWLERDRSWVDEPFDLLSLAYFYSGNKKESLVNAIIAYDKNKSDLRLKNNIDLILSNMDQ